MASIINRYNKNDNNHQLQTTDKTRMTTFINYKLLTDYIKQE